uniref:Putative DNA polymerase n=1 Tax=viral metagenome TaxID=1070528 RepID=A0A6M3LDD6_9ZZZZ
MRILGFDIETIPNQSIPESLKPQFNPDDIKTGNAGPEKAMEKIEKERVIFEQKLSKTMSTDPTLCQLCTFVGIIYDTDSGKSIEEIIVQVTAEDENDDYLAVTDGWKFIARAYHERIPLVSFNGIGFDLPIMFFRAMLQDVPVDGFMYNRLMMKYKNQYHYDLMQILAGWDKQRWNKLEYYLQLFGLGSKEGMSGADVYPAYMAGEFDKIRDYCRNDVLETCKLFARVAPWIYFQLEGGKD